MDKKAKIALDKVIDKARVHFYKPIHIAEILYRDRIENDIDVADLNTYRNASKAWRDIICRRFIGRVSTSSARYQDDVFNENAMPPRLLKKLSDENKSKGGIVEAYIYKKFAQRFTQLSSGLAYCTTHDKSNFQVKEFIDLFWHEPGLRRSIDKIYEIIVYSLFSALIDALEVKVEVSINPEKQNILEEFSDFTSQVIQINSVDGRLLLAGRINRVGVTNAADRGLDMWANFGLAIQIKHLSLTEELAENIVGSVAADRIIIVCKDSEEKLIVSLLNQIGWKSKIQSIITESNLINWYDRALRGKYSDVIGGSVLSRIISEIADEFPATNNTDFLKFLAERGYEEITDKDWQA